MQTLAFKILLGLLGVAIGLGIGSTYHIEHRYRLHSSPYGEASSTLATTTASQAKTQTQTPIWAKAYFAGGCFWCTESDFEKVPGVSTVISGYSGGITKDPTYETVNTETTGHKESVEVTYDTNKVSYELLVRYFFAHVNPTDGEGSFVDRGDSYKTAIFYQNDKELATVKKVEKELVADGIYDKPLVTILAPLTGFYKAEEYHQDYYKKNPLRYEYYRERSGRDAYLEAACKIRQQKDISCETPSDILKEAKQSIITLKIIFKPMYDWKHFTKKGPEEIKKMLTPLQYKVTEESGTEAPFQNEYWDNHRDGIYVDIISGEPLYSSMDKYESGTGWPSFVKPIDMSHLTEKEDNTFFTTRTEVRGKLSDAHLGHVFPDGPKDRGGMRYCMNSAAMKFIPKEDMEKEGYGEFLSLFK